MKAKIYYLVGTDHKKGWVKAEKAEAEITELKEKLELEENLHSKYRGKFHDKLEQIKELKEKINKALEHSEEDIRSSLRVMLIIEALKNGS